MSTGPKIEVTSNERELFIRFDGLTHFRIDRRELVALESWIVNRGRVTPVYVMRFHVRSASEPIILEYDTREKWTSILSQLDGVPFLNEWKVQDP